LGKRIADVQSQHNIPMTAIDDALKLLILLTTDPKKAREQLTPIVEQLDVITGASLPADLQRKVDASVIDVETAQEIARLRLSKGQVEQQNRFTQEQAQRQTEQTLRETMTSWDQAKRIADTAFKPKLQVADPDGRYEIFQAKLALNWQLTPPASVKDVVALMEKSYSEVNGYEKRFEQTKPKRKVLPPHGGSRNAEESVDYEDPQWARKVARKVVSRY
jgi:hypothetical protein